MSLRTLALVSGVYDLLLGLPMLLAAPLVARLFGAPEPVPVVNAWLNGVFALALARRLLLGRARRLRAAGLPLGGRRLRQGPGRRGLRPRPLR